MTDFKTFCEELTKDIQTAYEGSVTLDDAEKLAAKFLMGQIEAGKELQAADLDTRMRKSGLKAVKAAVYVEAATKGEKKPTEAMLAATVDMDKLVIGEQEAFDGAEVWKNQLENYLDVFRNAHIYFRGMAKGRFE